MDYNIILDSFQGPLEVLISLIEKAKVDIYDIPINLITEQYMKYLYEMDEINLSIASDFLLMASTLLQIKSRMLLPKEIIVVDGDEIEIDPREELVLQILAYKKFKEVSQQLRDIGEIESMAYYKPQEDLTMFEETNIELGPFDLDLLMKSINRIIGKRSEFESSLDLSEIKRDEFSIKDCTDDIINRLGTHKKISFSQLLNRNTTRNEIIAYFLSLLELTKSGYLTIRQNKSYSDINIIKLSNREQAI